MNEEICWWDVAVFDQGQKPGHVTAHNKNVTECELKVANFVTRKNLPPSLMDDISENVANGFLIRKLQKISVLNEQKDL